MDATVEALSRVLEGYRIASRSGNSAYLDFANVKVHDENTLRRVACQACESVPSSLLEVRRAQRVNPWPDGGSCKAKPGTGQKGRGLTHTVAAPTR